MRAAPAVAVAIVGLNQIPFLSQWHAGKIQRDVVQHGLEAGWTDRRTGEARQYTGGQNEIWSVA